MCVVYACVGRPHTCGWWAVVLVARRVAFTISDGIVEAKNDDSRARGASSANRARELAQKGTLFHTCKHPRMYHTQALAHYYIPSSFLSRI